MTNALLSGSYQKEQPDERSKKKRAKKITPESHWARLPDGGNEEA